MLIMRKSSCRSHRDISAKSVNNNSKTTASTLDRYSTCVDSDLVWARSTPTKWWKHSGKTNKWRKRITTPWKLRKINPARIIKRKPGWRNWLNKLVPTRINSKLNPFRRRTQKKFNPREEGSMEHPQRI